MGRVTGSPFVTSERCAAASTRRTRTPLLPSVWGLDRVSMAYGRGEAAVRAIRAALHEPHRTAAASGPVDRDAWHSLRSGYLANFLNPSLTAFYLIVIPQFIPRDEPFARSAMVLTAIHVSLAFSWHTAWAIAGSSLSRVLSQGRGRRAIDLCTGIVLLALAAKLAGIF